MSKIDKGREVRRNRTKENRTSDVYVAKRAKERVRVGMRMRVCVCACVCVIRVHNTVDKRFALYCRAYVPM